MRTTITIDDDVAKMLEKKQNDENKPFKQVVNEVLRRGLIDRTVSRDTEQQYATPTLKVGRPRYADLDNVSEVLAVAEREDYA